MSVFAAERSPDRRWKNQVRRKLTKAHRKALAKGWKARIKDDTGRLIYLEAWKALGIFPDDDKDALEREISGVADNLRESIRNFASMRIQEINDARNHRMFRGGKD